MFGLAAGFYRSYLAPAKLSVLFVGTDGAGKTTLLERVKVTQFRSYRGASAPDPPEVQVGKLKRWHSEGEAKPKPEKKDTGATRTAPASPGGDIIWLDDRGGGLASRPPAQIPAGPPPPPPALHHATSDPVAVAPSTVPRKRSFMRCPAPRAYSRESMASADRDEYEEVVLTPQTSRVGESTAEAEDCATRVVGREKRGTTTERPDNDAPIIPQTAGKPQGPGISNNKDVEGITRHRIHAEHDLKKGSKMLPLHAIRPTLGQNLGKIEACGCKLEILDLGGSAKMRPLWDRYLSDIDAVVFVVDASPLSSRSKLDEAIDAFQGVLKKLRQEAEGSGVSAPLEANVPVLIFANKIDVEYEDVLEENKQQMSDKGGNPAEEEDESEPLKIDLDELSAMFRADRQDPKSCTGPVIGSVPRSSERWNDSVVLCGGSAKTGEGVRSAFEWLIPTAKLAQRERQKLS